MITQQEIVSFFESHFLRITYNDKEITCSCPLCGDSAIDPERKRRFHYNFEKDQWHCFNCGKGWKINGFKQLVKVFGNKKEKLKYYIPFISNQKIKLKDNKKISLSKIYKKFKENVIFDDKLLTRDVILLHSFRKKRRIPYNFPIYLGINEWKNYIIIPVFINGYIYWWTGRRIDEITTKIPKYKTSNFKFSENDFPYLHKDRFKRNEPIIITESILDGIISQQNNITSISGIPSKKHIKNLLKFTDIGVIIALDQDKTGFLSSKKLLSYFKTNKKVKFFLYKNFKKYGKDFGDYIENKIISEDEIFEFILKNTIKNNLKCEMELKKWIKYVL